MDKELHEDFTAIADRIDIAHKHAIGYVDDRDPETMAENGWVRLPKDADGEYVHVGDVMEWCDYDGEVKVTCTVDAVGAGCFFAWDANNCRYAQKCANAYRHHHAPTVEDVLVDFFKACQTHASELGFCTDESKEKAWRAIAAEYAERLQLRGDA
jgi:hypothetical protein